MEDQKNMLQQNEDKKELEQQNQNNLISLFKQTNILTQNDWEYLNESKQFILDNYIKVPMYRPLPVKLFGVLNNQDHPTNESKYWQCKVEAEVHAEQLINDIHSLELIKLNIDKINHTLSILQQKYNNERDAITKEEQLFDIKEMQINKSKLEFRLIKLQKEIKYRIEEIYQWKQISDNLEKSDSFETDNYVKQYVNTMKARLENKYNSLEDTDENIEQKEDLKKQILTLNNLINKYS